MSTNTAIEQTNNQLEAKPVLSFSSYSMFRHAKFLKESSSLEIIPVLFWLIHAQRPECMVQFGMKTGTSYFALCQALESILPYTDSFLLMPHDTEIEIKKEIIEYNHANYADFSSIMVDEDIEYLESFNDNEIDLLVFNSDIGKIQEFYGNWKNKLKKDGLLVVLGIEKNNRKPIKKFVEGFKHSCLLTRFASGIAIISPNEAKNEIVESLFPVSDSKFRLKLFQNAFAKLGEACKYKCYYDLQRKCISNQQSEIERINDENKKLCNELNRLKECYENFQKDESLNILLSKKESEINNLKIISEEKLNIVEKINKNLKVEKQLQEDDFNSKIEKSNKELDNVTKENVTLSEDLKNIAAENNTLKKDLNAKALELKNIEKSLKEKDVSINDRFFELAKVNDLLINKDAELEKKCQELKKLNDRLGASEKKLTVRDQDIKKLNDKLGASEKKLTARDQDIKKLNDKLGASEKKLTVREQDIKKLNDKLGASEKKLTVRDQDIKKLNDKLGASEKKLTARDRDIKKLNDKINSLEKQLSLSKADFDKATNERFVEIATITNILISREKEIEELIQNGSRSGWKERIKSKQKLKADVKLIKNSGLFDENWYLKKYPEVAEKSMNPIVHYLQYGVLDEFDPSEKFDTSWYLETYPDVHISNFNPLIHYIKFGQNENRQPR